MRKRKWGEKNVEHYSSIARMGERCYRLEHNEKDTARIIKAVSGVCVINKYFGYIRCNNSLICGLSFSNKVVAIS